MMIQPVNANPRGYSAGPDPDRVYCTSARITKVGRGNLLYSSHSHAYPPTIDCGLFDYLSD